jgi:hypothetical protein
VGFKVWLVGCFGGIAFCDGQLVIHQNNGLSRFWQGGLILFCWWNMMMSESHTHTHALTHVTQKGYCSLMLLHHRDTPVGEIVYLDLPCVVAAVMC